MRLATGASSRIGLAVIFLGAALLSAYAALGGAILSGLLSALIWISAWLYYATLEIRIGPDRVIVRRFWRPIWQAQRAGIVVSDARGGDLKAHSCLLFSSPEQEASFEMLQSLFGKAAIGKVKEMLGRDG
ncbi:MAG: hypothetical protein J7498_03965 [Sphingobium sp.]|nr:hypothetical protein [Sphingobium sp.]